MMEDRLKALTSWAQAGKVGSDSAYTVQQIQRRLETYTREGS